MNPSKLVAIDERSNVNIPVRAGPGMLVVGVLLLVAPKNA
jgi:hypothetical protein